MAITEDMNNKINIIINKPKYLSPEVKELLRQRDYDKLAFHGMLVTCRGHCDIYCQMGLWMCTVCFHVECDVCWEHYDAIYHFDDGLNGDSICRMCGSRNSSVEFTRTSKPGLHIITEKEWERTHHLFFRSSGLSYSTEKKWSKIDRFKWCIQQWYQRRKCDCVECKEK
jgi:hypothetical protein